MSAFSILLCTVSYMTYKVNSKGYTLMYVDEVNEDGDFTVWGIDGFPSSCCNAVTLDDYGNHAEAMMGWMPLTATQNIAWTGYPGNTDYERILLSTYSADNNTFQITKKDDSSSAGQYLAIAEIPTSSCASNAQFNATALFVAKDKNADQIAYGCVNIDNGRYHVISEHPEDHDLFVRDSFWENGGTVYDPYTKQFTLSYFHDISP
eukprot:267823_1